MTDQNNRKQSRSRVKNKSNSFLYGVIAFLIILGIGSYFYFQRSSSKEMNNTSLYDGNSPVIIEETTPGVPTDQTQPLEPPFGEVAPPQPGSKEQILNQTQNPSGATNSNSEILLTDASNSSDTTDTSSSETNSTSSVTSNTNSEQCNPLIKELNAFYTHLDQQAYMKEFGLTESSKEHFSKLLQKLIDNPPVVARETDDLFTLLKNTAHFFRVLGKDNILILKGILDREKPSVESTLKTIYALTASPECLQKEYNLSISFDSLYDYAGFFLNTMGGRLYLFRRDSLSRMAVSYYAIMIVDKANMENNSPLGINVAPAIDFLIEEIENGGKRLKMREEYLDSLYDLKEKYYQ